jgi:hypothetical protein
MNKVIHVIGGGTVSHVRNHLGLVAPAYGTTARRIAELCREHSDKMDVELHLTKMADHTSSLETWDDLKELVMKISEDTRTKMIFFNPAVVDFSGVVSDVPPDKYTDRLESYYGGKPTVQIMHLQALPKLINMIRRGEGGSTARKDIFLVGFKATCGASKEEQYERGLRLLKQSSANLVLANDTRTHVNMIITPEEAAYHTTTDREVALRNLVEMAYLRSHLTFTRSIIIGSDPVGWESELVPTSLRTVVDHCIARGAYKKFLGVTAGHFAVKIDDHTFLTSRRKTDFNDMRNVGLVKVTTDGPDTVIAYGSKPSVGGQSQRILFGEHPEYDCVVHFHCPIKADSSVPVISQREFECGSHECGKNTSRGLRRFGNFSAVYLGNHGPNIVFNRSINPEEIISFIEANFDLTGKTGGYMV